MSEVSSGHTNTGQAGGLVAAQSGMRQWFVRQGGTSGLLAVKDGTSGSGTISRSASTPVVAVESLSSDRSSPGGLTTFQSAYKQQFVREGGLLDFPRGESGSGSDTFIGWRFALNPFFDVIPLGYKIVGNDVVWLFRYTGASSSGLTFLSWEARDADGVGYSDGFVLPPGAGSGELRVPAALISVAVWSFVPGEGPQASLPGSLDTLTFHKFLDASGQPIGGGGGGGPYNSLAPYRQTIAFEDGTNVTLTRVTQSISNFEVVVVIYGAGVFDLIAYARNPDGSVVSGMGTPLGDQLETINASDGAYTFSVSASAVTSFWMLHAVLFGGGHGQPLTSGPYDAFRFAEGE